MLKRVVKNEEGQVLVMTLVSMAILLGFLGLAIDVGVLFRAKRVVQTAADAAAIAGALELEYNGTPNVPTVARTAAGNNGISDTTNTVDVNLNPNITSPYHNASGYVEVVVHQPNPTIFIRALQLLTYGTSSMGSVNVAARAIAGVTPAPACSIQLDPSDADAFWIKGNTTVTTANCGIQVNSSSPDAFCDQGNATVDGVYIHITGNQAKGGKCSKNPGTPVTPYTPPVNDPFAGLPEPYANGQCNSGNTITAGSYTGTGAVTPSTQVNVPVGQSFGNTSSNVTCFSASNVQISGTLGGSVNDGQIFVFENGVKISGTTTVNGTLDIAGGSFNQNNATLNLNAPGSNNNPAAKGLTYNGIAIYQPSSNTAGACVQDNSSKQAMSNMSGGVQCLQVQSGSGSGNLDGYLYAPHSLVWLQDQGGSVEAEGVVSYSLAVNSQLTFTNNYNIANSASTPLTTVSLVE